MSTAVPLRRPPTGPRRRIRYRWARQRRWLAAAAVAGAVGTAVHAITPAPPATEPVPVAGQDLAGGHILTASDLVTVAWPRGTRPDGVLAAPLGRTLATAVRRGEPVTDTRVTGPGLLDGQPTGTVAVTLRLSDPASAVLLGPGRRIDVLGGPVPDRGSATTSDGSGTDGSGEGGAEVLADDVLVLAVPQAGEGAGGTGGWLGVGDPDSAGAGAGAGAGAEGGGSSGADAGSSGTGSSRADGSIGSGVLVVAADRHTAARLATASGTRSISAVLTR